MSGCVFVTHYFALHFLNLKIRPLLRNRVSWRTRMTAAMAIGEVARAVPEWKPQVQLVVTASAGTKATSSATSSKRADGASTSVTSTTDEISGTPLHGTNANTINLDPSLLTLARFSLANVLERGDKLLASAGKEFDDVANVTLLSSAATSSDARERLRLQQVDLRRRLGLGSEFIDLLDEQDLAVTTTKTGGAVDEKVAAENVAAKIGIDSTMDVDEDLPVSATSLSARERARLKRKARVDAKKRGGGGQTVVRTAGVEDSGDAGGTAAADTSATSGHRHSQLRLLETREQRLQSLEEIGINEIIAVPCSMDGKDDEQVMKNAASSMTTSPDDNQSLIVEARRSTFVWEDLDEWPFAALCEELALDLFE